MPSAPSNHATIRSQVQARLGASVIGTSMHVFGLSVSGGGKFKSASLLDPPIPSGLTETMATLKKIIMKNGAVSQADFAQVPGLLRRVRQLLRVYYDAKITRKKTEEFKYCDADDLSQVGLDLHELGLFLQLSPARLRALLRSAPDVEQFVIDEPLDIGKWRKKAHEIEQAVAADPEAEDEDRERAFELEDKLTGDLAAFQMVYFVADILVAFLLIPPLDESEKLRADRAMKRLVEYATDPLWRLALGDPLTDSMRPVYWTKSLLVRFAHAGGLPALLEDWCQSMAKEVVCKDALESLPSKAWEHQTEDSLQGVMRALIHKVEFDGDDVASTPLFVKIVYEVYSRYGLAPFEKGSTLSHDTILVYFLHRRMSRKPAAYRTEDAMRSLLQKYANIPRTTRRRHGWMILSVPARWQCIEFYGCAYGECPEGKALKRMAEHRVKGVRDPVAEERLFRWGGLSKACTSCREVSYCSPECQKAHWKDHKAKCKVSTAENKSKVEVEI